MRSTTLLQLNSNVIQVDMLETASSAYPCLCAGYTTVELGLNWVRLVGKRQIDPP